jgi:hypothetical protein
MSRAELLDLGLRNTLLNFRRFKSKAVEAWRTSRATSATSS